MELCVVAGAGGFIGGHLVSALVADGHRVRAVDAKPLSAWHQRPRAAETCVVDLSDRDACRSVVTGARVVYNLAADMGGIAFIEGNRAQCMLNVLIDTHLLLAARDAQVERYFYASSACVYAAGKQDRPDVVPLAEDAAYPALPEDGYGWEKLFGERMCRHFSEDFGLATRVARYHNVYGPHGAIDGGREKAPAAICRKVITAKLTGDRSIEVWGDGRQTRSFTYVDDCVVGTRLLTSSQVADPLNIGSDEMVTIDELIDVVEAIAGVRLARRYLPAAPQGVRGRSSDNSQIRRKLGWAPSTSLAAGMEATYRWIYDRMVAGQPAANPVSSGAARQPTTVSGGS
jgi:GDP-D-mannose 3',5'-epimerase